MTNIYFVRHAQSCSNIATIGKIQHPPLSYEGIQQAVYLGIDNKIIDKYFDEYYCSPSLRTIMTACLALRNKKDITLKLNSNLIENKNFANVISADQQNAVVKSENLKKMIEYIKSWFQNKYFDNFIDYEFISLIYDLVLLLHINNRLSKPMYALLFNNDDKTRTRTEILRNLIDLISLYDNFESPLLYITKSESKLLYDNNKYNIIKFLNGENFEICMHFNSQKKLKLSDIIESLKKFLDINYYFNNNITISYDYKEDSDIEEKHKIQNFIDFLDKDKKNILCFSHGETLRKYFQYEQKLKNTEIVCYNTETTKNERIKRDEIADIPENIENICGFPYFTTIFNPEEVKMFYVINNMFNNEKYDVNSDKRVLDLYKTHKNTKTSDIGDYVDVSQVGGRYKHKYLKYKYKYLNYKKIKLNN
jgi:broad specificity phosphatase PhoE